MQKPNRTMLVAGRNKQNVEVCRDTAAGINPVFSLSDNLPVLSNQISVAGNCVKRRIAQKQTKSFAAGDETE